MAFNLKALNLLRPPVNASPKMKPMINLGAGLDIMTGDFVEGPRGEYILNGGLAYLTGVVGIGNNFKSTIENWFNFQLLSRFPLATVSLYDTEINIHHNHLRDQYMRIPELQGEDVIETGRFVVSDKTMHTGEEWHDRHREFCLAKTKNANDLLVTTPFWNDDRSGPRMVIMPTASIVDSFTEFETSDVTKMQMDNDLGESGGNTIHMRQGLAKLRFLMEAPRLNVAAGNYLCMTAHIGKESTMASSGPGPQIPIVKLKTLKNGDKIKGVTDKFTFMTQNCWQAYNTVPLINKDTRQVMYPRHGDDNTTGDVDLHLVELRNLRSKSGPSGMPLKIIVSQTEGVLSQLTEYHYLRDFSDRTNPGFGLVGSNVSCAMTLYPDVKLGRTTVRQKIDTDHRLRAAITLTAEICQQYQLWPDIDTKYRMTMTDIYNNVKALGYDWSVLLDTRSWWTYKEAEDQYLPFLSSRDIMRMALGEYHPYWYPVAKDKLLTSNDVGATKQAVSNMLSDIQKEMTALLEAAKEPA